MVQTAVDLRYTDKIAITHADFAGWDALAPAERMGLRDLGRALRSASRDATLMVEDALLSFRENGSAVNTRDMDLHRLPWPSHELLSLGAHDVELRVTLSYSSSRSF